MRRALPLLLAAFASPALAQHDHHAMEMAADPQAQDKAPEQEVMDPHAGHAMPAEASPEGDEPHAGHEVPASSPAAVSGPDYAADALYGAQAMAAARETLRREHGDIRSGMILIDRLEARIARGKDGYAWRAQGWYGGDIDRLFIKTEGEGRFGEKPEAAEVQALWSHAIDPWFNLQAGIRQDFGKGPDRTHAVIGIQGLAPYRFETDAALFLSGKGDVTARLELEYDQRLTRKLILQPAMELNLAAQDVPELGIGSGLSFADLGLRLRYEFVPEFAPYLGVRYERAFGDTADFRRTGGDKAGGWSFLTGIRAWF